MGLSVRTLAGSKRASHLPPWELGEPTETTLYTFLAASLTLSTPHFTDRQTDAQRRLMMAQSLRIWRAEPRLKTGSGQNLLRM